MFPSDTAGSWIPAPRNDSTASVRIATPTVSVKNTTMGPTAFGSMCRKMIRGADAPDARAASTNSFSRSERNSPRTIRAIGIHTSTHSTKMMPSTLFPYFEPSISNTATAGRIRNRSVTRIRI